MNVVDEFIIYDNIQYTKKGWINRNRILHNGKSTYITIPLKKDSDYLDIKDRYLSSEWETQKNKTINKINSIYRRAPYFEEVFPLFNKIILHDKANLFQFIELSLLEIKKYLGIDTKIYKSSLIDIDHQLKSEEKVIAICKAIDAAIYINPIGGTKLYDRKNFEKEGIRLAFLESKDLIYKQLNYPFIPSLSILDVMMFNSKEKILSFLNEEYTLV